MANTNIILKINCRFGMKIAHKRVPSGIENTPLLQNTQRMQAPKKSQPEPQTSRKQSISEQQFVSILHQTGIYHIYQCFLAFHLDTQNLIKHGNAEETMATCVHFGRQIDLIRQPIILGSVMQQDQQPDDSPCGCGQADKIRQLLEEVNRLRKIITEMDCSINMESISSLSPDGQAQLDTIRARTQWDPQPQSPYHQLHTHHEQWAANFLQLKTVAYEILGIAWVLISTHLPDEGAYLMQRIRHSYALEMQLGPATNPQAISSSLDNIASLACITRALATQIEQSLPDSNYSL